MLLLTQLVLGAAACILLGAALARHRRQRPPPRLDMHLQARERELSELSTHLQNFAENERSELAHNLHDELGGLLTAAKMDLSWLQARVDQPPNPQRLTQLGEALDQAMDVKRRVVEQLRPSLLDHFGLATALRAHVEATCANANLQCEAALDDSVDAVPKNIEIALFRLVQEGLTNIIHHAGARRVRLEFGCDERNFTLKLADDGRGFDLHGDAFRWSHGLSGMRQRVKALHGRFTLHSNPGSGTRIEVEVPKPVT